MNKEIREEAEKLRKNLYHERKYFKKHPLNESDLLRWEECFSKYKNEVKDLNSKIDRFNLVVPILDKQFFHLNLEKEAEKVLVNGAHCDDDFVRKPCSTENEITHSHPTLFSIFDKLFK